MGNLRELPECAKCKIKTDERACCKEGGAGPATCPTKHMHEAIDKAGHLYKEEGLGEFARQASIQEAECYIDRDAEPFFLHPVKPRIQEICEFAEKMGYRRLGLAYCLGLRLEAIQLSKVLEKYGFDVVSVACKVGCVPKEEIGIKDTEKVRIGKYESMCNPIAQAEVLNEARCDFNIIMGLCVGHDSLFFKHAQAMTTVFAVKDRVLGHNPLAALYNLEVYYQRLLKERG
jgi:uncharacterized metal-binding protein